MFVLISLLLKYREATHMLHVVSHFKNNLINSKLYSWKGGGSGGSYEREENRHTWIV